MLLALTQSPLPVSSLHTSNSCLSSTAPTTLATRGPSDPCCQNDVKVYTHDAFSCSAAIASRAAEALEAAAVRYVVP